MSQSVDVLAVIQEHVSHYEGLQRHARDEGNDHYADELDEESGTLNQLRLARAAVAELIEVLDVAAYGEYLPETVEQEIRSALARVRGAA